MYHMYKMNETKENDIQLGKSKGEFTFTNASLKLPSSALTYSQICESTQGGYLVPNHSLVAFLERYSPPGLLEVHASQDYNR